MIIMYSSYNTMAQRNANIGNDIYLHIIEEKLRQISPLKMETKNDLHPERGYRVLLLTLEICLAKLFLIENTKFHVSLTCPNYHMF